MSQLVRDDAGGDADAVTDLMQVLAQFADEVCLWRRAGEQPSIAGNGSKERKKRRRWTSLTYERVHRDHALSLQLAERHVNGPLIRAEGWRQSKDRSAHFTDAHAGVTKQQEDIGAEIIAAEELLLDS